MRFTVFTFGIILLLCSCVSSLAQRNTSDLVPDIPSTAINSSSNLDSCILSGVKYLITRMSPGVKVAVVSIESPTENLSNYVIDNISMYLVNEDKFIVIERKEIGILQKEQKYQMSGEVSDETAVYIGHQLGVQVIITGSIIETGGKYSFRLKAIDVETAQILGTRIYIVEQDQTIIALLTPPAKQQEITSQSPPEQKIISQQPIINGDVNITTNNNTTINGDVYINKPKWFDVDSFMKE